MKIQTNIDHFQMYTKSKFSASVFEDQRLERTDFAVVHNSPSIGAGPSVALFWKLEDGELSGKVLSQRAAIKCEQVTVAATQ